LRVLDILVHCHEFAAFTSGPRYAAQLAGTLGASLTGLYVAPPLPHSPPPAAPATLASEFLAFVHDELDCAQKADVSFAHKAEQFGAPAAQWQVALGRLPAVLAAAGNWNDLIVIEHRERVPRECAEAIASSLLSGVPCIVVRESTKPASARWNRIAIAWNGSPEAIRAVHAALPVLQLAEQIFLLASPATTRSAPLTCEPEFSIEAYLARHALVAQYVPLDLSQRPAEEAILIASASVAADLLVMGAFGTTRLHADAPRGVTHYILEQGLLPLLLHH
jgi:nucleotide-binding universal stress UspA family protein